MFYALLTVQILLQYNINLNYNFLVEMAKMALPITFPVLEVIQDLSVLPARSELLKWIRDMAFVNHVKIDLKIHTMTS